MEITEEMKEKAARHFKTNIEAVIKEIKDQLDAEFDHDVFAQVIAERLFWRVVSALK